jgi:hypothetical protein
MRRVPPSVHVREELNRLLSGGVETETNVVSAFVELAIRLVVQQLLEAEQADVLGGRGRDERRGEGQRGSRNGYEPGRIRTAEGAIPVAVPQVRGADQPFRSSLMSLQRATPRSSSASSPRCTRGGCPRKTSRTPSGTRPGSC